MQQSIARHLDKLAAEIGARPSGSPVNHAAAVDVNQLLDVAALTGRITRTIAAHDANWPRKG